jgi:hypothetical protein
MKKVRESILDAQKSWATGHGIEFNKKGYVQTLQDNLYQPLKDDALDEFVRGRGSELEKKMLALHSSSALVVNFFHYWRYFDISTLSEKMGLPTQYTQLQFEKTYPKPEGIPGIRPHIDIELSGESRPVAIESKFTEPYSRSRTVLKKIYTENINIWGNLSNCKLLANQLVTGNIVFEYLDVPQLLKHILGLKTAYGEEGFLLIYLWYEYPSINSDRHNQEIQTFITCIGNEIDFRAMTYQELFKSISSIPGINKDYLSYMQERYFAL